jgi:uncharacterized protein DUF948
MEQQLPTALQTALYVGSFAIVALTSVLIVLLLQLGRQIERFVRTVEELKAELGPLARETRVVVEGLRELSGRVQGQWMEVERIIDTARTWSERANHLVEEIGSVVEPPIFAMSRKIQIFRKGLETFVRALSQRNQTHQRKARVS